VSSGARAAAAADRRTAAGARPRSGDEAGRLSNIVRIDLDQAATGRVLVFPVRPLVLRVSVEDPDGLRAALGAAVP
jgi:hypothetical protein